MHKQEQNLNEVWDNARRTNYTNQCLMKLPRIRHMLDIRKKGPRMLTPVHMILPGARHFTVMVVLQRCIFDFIKIPSICAQCTHEQ